MNTAFNQGQFQDANKARQYLEALRWPNGPVCPHCASVAEHYRLEGKAHRPGLLKCKDCRQQFSVTVGTVFERSKIGLHVWLQAAFLMVSSKKGVSAHQIHRTLGVTYKTAWFMCHRIREAMKDNDGSLLGGPGTSGVVEADETYYGKAKTRDKSLRYAQKQKIVALVERKGRVRAFHVPDVNAKNLKPILAQVDRSARLMTDSSSVYLKSGNQFASHETVNHLIGEYARGDVTTNTVEGFFGILKRGIDGVYQHVSKEHLHRYVNEFAFRYNNRSSVGVEDGERAARMLLGIGGKRLTYRRTDATA